MSKPSMVQKILRTSLHDAWQWVDNPSLQKARLDTPAAVSPIQAVRTLFPEIPTGEIDKYRLEFLSSNTFFNQIAEGMVQRRARRPRWIGWLEFFYVAVRLLRPDIICETGVFDGESSATTLLALERNGNGKLISIDLPAVDPIESSTDRMQDATLPQGCLPGWIIPDDLRHRWELLLGDSKVLLPQVLQKHPVLDIFFHDSLHTFEHQYFEYSAAWPNVRTGGLLLSDDILWNHAFQKFCAEKNQPYVNIADRNHHYWTNFNEGFGATRKAGA
jgi:predicted O-methyltransferase YrrM